MRQQRRFDRQLYILSMGTDFWSWAGLVVEVNGGLNRLGKLFKREIVDTWRAFGGGLTGAAGV